MGIADIMRFICGEWHVQRDRQTERMGVGGRRQIEGIDSRPVWGMFILWTQPDPQLVDSIMWVCSRVAMIGGHYMHHRRCLAERRQPLNYVDILYHPHKSRMSISLSMDVWRASHHVFCGLCAKLSVILWIFIFRFKKKLICFWKF